MKTKNTDHLGCILNDNAPEKKNVCGCIQGQMKTRAISHNTSSFFSMGYTTKYVLNISEKLINKHSVVSKQVAEEMSIGVKKLFKTDYAIAVTGNAGPTKGDSDVEVGTVCIAIATPKQVYSEEFSLGNHRTKVINKTVNKAFEILQKEISKN